MLSAMALKQWRVPSTFSLLCFLTKLRTCWRELAGYRLSVLYLMLPAQFVSLPPAALPNSGEIMGLASNSAQRSIKVLLFIAVFQAVSTWRAECTLFRLPKNDAYLTLLAFLLAKWNPCLSENAFHDVC